MSDFYEDGRPTWSRAIHPLALETSFTGHDSAANDSADPTVPLRSFLAGIIKRAVEDAQGEPYAIDEREELEDVACEALTWLALDDVYFPLYCRLLDLDPDDIFNKLVSVNERIATRWRRMLNEYPPLAHCSRYKLAA
jgi:hypothetical protein